MANGAFTEFLAHVRAKSAEAETDADLLREYARSRSEGAFAELVRRFAPLVWTVCVRTVGHRQQAEDAFQAVFLVLSRKSASVKPPSALAGWLHAVAVHTSMRARAMVERRREALCPTVPDRAAPDPADPCDPELVRIIGEEVARLPDKLRAAVVLCELDGLSRHEAARRLGIAEGTLSSRLAAARKRLASRLRGRGVSLGVGCLVALLARGPASAAPPVPPEVSRAAAELAEEVVRTMFLSKLKLLGAAALVAVLLATAVAADRGGSSEPARPAAPARRIAPGPKPGAPAAREGVILLWVDEKPLLLKPDGTPQASPDPIPKSHHGVGSGTAHLSPDGSRIAFMLQGDEVKRKPGAVPPGAVVSRFRTNLKILDLGGKNELKGLDEVDLNGYHWLGDGKTLHVRGQQVAADGTLAEKMEDWVYDPATGKRTPLQVPEDFVIRAVGPDGKTAVVDEWKMSPERWHQHAHLWTIGGGKPTPLLELNQSLESPTPRFSPDGKRLLCKVNYYGKHTPEGNGVWTLDDFKFNDVVVIDLATRKRSVVKELGEDPEWRVGGLAWSPDGKRIAYVETKRVPRQPGAPGERNPYRVVVADPDGKNAKEVYVAEGAWLVGFDWR